MDLRKKLLFAVCGSGLLAVLGTTLLFLQSTAVIDLTQYFPAAAPSQTGKDQNAAPETTEAAAAQPTEEETGSESAPTPAVTEDAPAGEKPLMGSKTGSEFIGGSGTGGKGSEAEPEKEPEQPVVDYGDIGTQVGTRNESRTANPGFISSTVIKLTDKATEWAQPGHQPEIGDRIGITLPIPPNGKRFVIEVVYISERADGSGLTLHGRLEELGSSVLMMTVGNTIELSITDYAANRIYHVSLIAGTDEYTVEEWDLSKQHKATEFFHNQ